MALQALPKSSWLVLLLTVVLGFLGSAPLSAPSPSCPRKNTTLYLAAMAPFPDSSPGLEPGWSGGPAVIPGSQVAVRHINSRCDILEDFKLELLVGDSGCSVMSKASINLTSTLFHQPGGKRIIGIVGPGCSEAAKIIGRFLANPAISLLNIAPSATSPELVDSVTYPNTFRPIASTLGFISMYAELIRLMGYTKVAILFEAERTFHIDAAAQMLKRVKSNGVEVASFAMFGRFSIPLSEIVFNYRIVFVFAGGSLARKLMCLAYRKSMIYPTYQYFFSDRRLNHFTSDTGRFRLDGEDFSCTESDMRRAIQGIVLSEVRLTREDQEVVLESGMTYNDFVTDYDMELTDYAEQLNINTADIVDTEHESGYYDSTWALALSFQGAISALKNDFNMSLSEYGFGQPRVTDLIRQQLLQVNFKGIRGRVQFNSNTLDGVDVTVLDMSQITDDPESPEIRVATFLPKSNTSGSQNDSKSALSIADQSAFIEGFFPDEFISPPIYIEIVVLIVTAVVALGTVCFHFMTIKWNNLHTLKATSPALNHMIFSGCYLYILSIVFLSFQQLDTTHDPVAFGVGCSSFIWCESLALTLIFGTICVKTWRVFRIFSHSSAKVLRNLEDYRLILYVSGFLLIDIIFNLAWNSKDPWFMYLAGQDRLKMRVICNCDNVIVWLSCLLGLKAPLTFVVLYLSIATRRIPKKEYKQTKSTNALVYCLIFLYSFTIPVYLILLSQTSVGLVTVSYIALCFKNITCIVLCAVFIFIPPVLPVMKTEVGVMTTRLTVTR